MNRRRAIVSKVLVSQKQVKTFQVKLPHDTKKVLGVEMGLQWLDGDPPDLTVALPVWKFGLTMPRNYLVGDLILQSSDTANVFYAGETRFNRSTGFGDFTNSQFKPMVFSHNGNFLHEPAFISGKGKLISATYRDRLSEFFNSKYTYLLKVYVWIETQGTKEKGGSE